MFHSEASSGKFDRTARSLTKTYPMPADLETYNWFCSVEKSDENFVDDKETIVEHQFVDAQTREAFVDFRRPFKAKGDNSMDLAAGDTYLTYLSFYLRL